MDKLLTFMSFASNLAMQSKCTERKIAAVITDKEMRQVYSIGINGGPKNLMDCMCIVEGKYGCVHAEINALIKDRSNDKDKIMFVTLSPCKTCAAAIINAPGGFSAVYYDELWKDESGIKLLKTANILVERVPIISNKTTINKSVKDSLI